METSQRDSLLRSAELDPRHLTELASSRLGDSVVRGELDVVEALLNAGVKPNRRVLLDAMRDKNLGAARLLMKYEGADPNAADHLRTTPVLHAVFQNDPEMVRALHAYGAKLDVANDKGWSPLSRACKQGERAMVELLLKLGADIRFDDEGKRLSALALAGGNADLVRYLLEQGADPDASVERERETSILMQTVYSEQPAIRKLLLDHGAQDRPNAAGWTAAMVAHDRFKPFPDAQAAFPLDGPAPDTRFHQAAVTGDIAGLRALIEAAKVEGDHVARLNAFNRFGTTPLFLAALKKKHEIVALLLDEGADPAQNATSGNAPVTVSVAHQEQLQRLLAMGATANEEPGNSRALVAAVSGGYRGAWESLLAAGASASSKQGANTALHVATKKGERALMKSLIGGGAALDEQDVDGETPLHLAARNDDAEAVALLLGGGASSTIRNNQGYTALGQAFTISKIAAASALLAGGANYYGPHKSAAVQKTYSAQTMFVFKPKELRPLLIPRAVESAKRGTATTEDLEILCAAGESELAAEAVAKLDAEATKRALPFVLRELPSLGEQLVDKGVCLEPGVMLVEVAASGSTRLIQERLDAGDDPNTVLGGWSNRSPLSQAVTSGNTDAVRLLLDAGADPNAFLGSGSPLMLAAKQGWNNDMVRLLIEHGADTKDRVDKKTAEQHAKAAEQHAKVATAAIAAASEAKSHAERASRIKTIDGFLKEMDDSDLAQLATLLPLKKQKGASAQRVLQKLHAILIDAKGKAGFDAVAKLFIKRVAKEADVCEAYAADCIAWSDDSKAGVTALMSVMNGVIKKSPAPADALTKFLTHAREGGRARWKMRMAILEWQLDSDIVVGDGKAFSPFSPETTAAMAALAPLRVVAQERKTDPKKEFAPYLSGKKKSGTLSYTTRYFLAWLSGLPQFTHDDGDCQQNVRCVQDFKLVKNKLVVEWGWMETYQVYLLVEAKMKPFTAAKVFSVDHEGPYDYLNPRGSIAKFLAQMAVEVSE